MALYPFDYFDTILNPFNPTTLTDEDMTHGDDDNLSDMFAIFTEDCDQDSSRPEHRGASEHAVPLVIPWASQGADQSTLAVSPATSILLSREEARSEAGSKMADNVENACMDAPPGGHSPHTDPATSTSISQPVSEDDARTVEVGADSAAATTTNGQDLRQDPPTPLASSPAVISHLPGRESGAKATSRWPDRRGMSAPPAFASCTETSHIPLTNCDAPELADLSAAGTTSGTGSDSLAPISALGSYINPIVIKDECSDLVADIPVASAHTPDSSSTDDSSLGGLLTSSPTRVSPCQGVEADGAESVPDTDRPGHGHRKRSRSKSRRRPPQKRRRTGTVRVRLLQVELLLEEGEKFSWNRRERTWEDTDGNDADVTLLFLDSFRIMRPTVRPTGGHGQESQVALSFVPEAERFQSPMWDKTLIISREGMEAMVKDPTQSVDATVS